MKTMKAIAVSLLFMLLVGGCAMTTTDGRSSVPLPPGTLTAGEVTALFSGRTVESVLDSNNRVSLTYYNPNGQTSQLQSGQKRSGAWRVDDGGRICLKFGEEREKCRIIVKEGAVYAKYVVKKSGQHERVLTYTSFTEGNRVGL